MTRRFAYEAAHPNVEIHSLRPFWQAVVHQDQGETVITRDDLKKLLDALEELEQPGESER